MRTEINIPNNFYGTISLTSIDSDSNFIVNIPNNFYGTISVHNDQTIAISGRNSVKELDSEINYIDTLPETPTSTTYYLASKFKFIRLFDTFSTFYSNHKKFIIVALALAVLHSQATKVLLHHIREVEVRVDAKILEERRHSHIQFLMETRYK